MDYPKLTPGSNVARVYEALVNGDDIIQKIVRRTGLTNRQVSGALDNLKKVRLVRNDDGCWSLIRQDLW